MTKTMREVLIHQGEDGKWYAECPSLAGCVSQGETYEIALENINETIRLWIAEAIENGKPIPPSDIQVSRKLPFFYKTISVLLVLLIFSCPVWFCWRTGFSGLMWQNVLWKRSGSDDYTLRVQNGGLGFFGTWDVTVCDNQVVEACLMEADHTQYCYPSKNEKTGLMEEIPKPVQSYTIDALFDSAFSKTLSPTCGIKMNTKLHHPSYIGCFFIEGSSVDVSNYQAIDCSADFSSK